MSITFSDKHHLNPIILKYQVYTTKVTKDFHSTKEYPKV